MDLSLPPNMPEVGSLWRHLKTRVIYEVTGGCRIEAINEPAVLYRRQDDPDSVVWARPVDEFLDGRFSKLKYGGPVC